MPLHRHDGGDLDACASRGKLDLLKEQFHEGIPGIAERGDTAHRGKHVTEHLDTFAVRLRSHQRHPGDVAARAIEACYEAASTGLAAMATMGMSRVACCAARAHGV
jgi:hypothetical protein